MSEERALEVVEGEFVQLGTIKANGPHGVIEAASAIATQLASIVDSRQLFSVISGKKFVRVEGWTTLGAMLGILPRELSVERREDGGYEATVELVRTSDGAIVGRGSALCGMDERRWGNADEYARRSMSITRATGKAYRLGFSWIMTLAGYEPTPFEEMPTKLEPRKQSKSKGKKGRATSKDWHTQAVQALLDNNLAQNSNNGAAMLAKSKLAKDCPIEDVVKWGKVYRGSRDQDLSSDDAAKGANETLYVGIK